MPKGPRLSNYDKDIISQIYNRNRGAKAYSIQQLASERLHREIGLSTIQRELAKLRVDKHRGSTDPIDDQWSLGSLREYPVDTKNLNFLLFIQATFMDNIPDEVKQNNKEKGYKPPFMSNRLANWISRFLPLIPSDPNYVKDDSLYLPSTPDDTIYKWSVWVKDLVDTAMWYSNYEIACELKGIRPVNTINFDAPSLPDIRRHINLYSQAILDKQGIREDDPDLIDKLKARDIRDIAPKGGRK